VIVTSLRSAKHAALDDLQINSHFAVSMQRERDWT
jgi:hypothetical protein